MFKRSGKYHASPLMALILVAENQSKEYIVAATA
jgi:hypothetical protein